MRPLVFRVYTAFDPSTIRGELQLADLLGRLSGRQKKRGCRVSASMILVGLEKLLGVLALLEGTTLEELRGLLKELLPGIRGTG